MRQSYYVDNFGYLNCYCQTLHNSTQSKAEKERIAFVIVLLTYKIKLDFKDNRLNKAKRRCNYIILHIKL